MATAKDVLAWAHRDLDRWGKDSIEQVDEYKFRIYTEENRYSISIVDSSAERPQGYLGCIAVSRKSRAGEDWCRGNDLPDGPCSEETWREILADIVSYELVKVHKRIAATPRSE